MSLVEVLIATAVLAVMAVPMIAMFTLGNQFSVSGERDLQAGLIAHELVERMRAEIERNSNQSERPVIIPGMRAELPPGYTFQVQTEPIETELHRVTVAVRWLEGKRNRELTLSTLVSVRPARQTRPLGAASQRELGAPSGVPPVRPGFRGFGGGP